MYSIDFFLFNKYRYFLWWLSEKSVLFILVAIRKKIKTKTLQGILQNEHELELLYN